VKTLVGSATLELPDGDRHLRPPRVELSNLGFLPLLHNKDTHSAVFMGAGSCQRPRHNFDAAAIVNAEAEAEVNYTICVSRFAHYLKVMARDLLAASVPLEECQQVLGEWLRRYSLSGEESERMLREWDNSWARKLLFSRPIGDVALELRPSPRGSGHEVTVTFVPFLQMPVDLGLHTFRLVLPVPQLT
jgi:type VI secretion system protein ImpC